MRLIIFINFINNRDQLNTFMTSLQLGIIDENE